MIPWYSHYYIRTFLVTAFRGSGLRQKEFNKEFRVGSISEGDSTEERFIYPTRVLNAVSPRPSAHLGYLHNITTNALAPVIISLTISSFSARFQQCLFDELVQVLTSIMS
jgi:hypothetical protein